MQFKNDAPKNPDHRMGKIVNCTLYLLTLDSGINVGVRLLILGIFSSGYVLIKGGTFINLFIFHLLNIYFYFVSFSYV